MQVLGVCQSEGYQGHSEDAVVVRLSRLCRSIQPSTMHSSPLPSIFWLSVRLGIPFSVAFLLLVTLFEYITACYLMEVQSRVHALVRRCPLSLCVFLSL